MTRPLIPVLLATLGFGMLAPSVARADDFVFITPNAPAPLVRPVSITTAAGPAVPTPAWPACGDDTVVLHDGGMVRGIIVELIPRNQVTLKLSTGKVVTVPWTEVHHVEQGGPIGRTCGADHSRSRSPTASAALDDAGTLTLVVPESGYTLEAQHGTEWESVCNSPCESVVRRDRFYRLTAPGIQTSTNFRPLGEPGARVVLRINPGHTVLLGVGILGVTVGGAAAVLGYLALPMQSSYRGREQLSWAFPTMIVGGVATLASAFLMEANIKTKVGQQAHDAERPPIDHPAIRVAPSKEARARGVEPRGPAFTMPILAGHF